MFKLLFFVMALTMAIVITWPLTNQYLVFTHTVIGSSMNPNLKDKDYILLKKKAILKLDFMRGDIVLFKNPEDPSQLLVQRIVGLPKERLVIQGGYVYINESPLPENYLTPGMLTAPGEDSYEGYENVIPPKSHFVLNDRRFDLTDSRQFGAITTDSIIGKLWFKIY